MFFLGLTIYVVGGASLYFFVDDLAGLGCGVSHIYSYFFLVLDARISTYSVMGFFWSTFCHTVWIILFSEKTESWVSEVGLSNVMYLFVRVFVFLFFSFVILGVVGIGVAKKPFSDFHQFFSILVPCLLLGGWVWSVRDFLIAAFNYEKGSVI
ncbi:hypothetical protein CU664_11095 [Pseudomonas syringae pv. actinidifoliorum]|uniref:hypothetical protein n=1 Tax=Pseudomonas syringae TaxID=317 RepID=UPI0013727460|nr:hypothetical protein [Pseudomonas syringae]NAS97317.1 hypothetical protein [Pseudomonas syringae pv. actinidifoliorum]NAT63798.1 hypothetical protein [Pseudomonas syringae pv. actinidifoliorum]